MIAMLWAQQIMLNKKTFGQVPRQLKEPVQKLLADAGWDTTTAETTG